jgi:hypothetical protein
MPACALCKNEASLRASHIIPKFVFRLLRETSATGFMRSGLNPKKRAQDGLKVALLCDDCEQLFSRWERDFANEVFTPMVREKVAEVTYSDWLLKFCVSISWRVLTHVSGQNLLSHLGQQQKRQSARALDRWSQFLLGKVSHPDRFEQRLVILSTLRTAPPGRLWQPNSNRYILRSVDVDIASNESSAFTFSKIGPIALFGMIEADGHWRGTKVNANEGVLGVSPYNMPVELSTTGCHGPKPTLSSTGRFRFTINAS